MALRLERKHYCEQALHDIFMQHDLTTLSFHLFVENNSFMILQSEGPILTL